MIAAAAGQSIPLGWISALVGVVTVLVVAVKAGRLLGQTEAHLKAQDETLAKQDESLDDLRSKLDDLRDRPTT